MQISWNSRKKTKLKPSQICECQQTCFSTNNQQIICSLFPFFEMRHNKFSLQIPPCSLFSIEMCFLFPLSLSVGCSLTLEFGNFFSARKSVSIATIHCELKEFGWNFIIWLRTKSPFFMASQKVFVMKKKEEGKNRIAKHCANSRRNPKCRSLSKMILRWLCFSPSDCMSIKKDCWHFLFFLANENPR